MNKKLFLLLLYLLPQFYFLNAQENGGPYSGIFVDQNDIPMDVVSLFITESGSEDYLYTDTFLGGKFDISFVPAREADYEVTVMSLGYDDLHLKLGELHGKIVFRQKRVVLDDVVVEGKRDVKVTLGEQGGILYDVGNTFLSGLGTSTMLLNYIPGLNVSEKGDLSVIAAEGDIRVYINGILMEEKQKLLTLKGEDIKSVELIRSPGAKYKNAGAVVLIKTKKALDGFGSRVSMDAYLYRDGKMGWMPQADISYTKNKLSVSASYQYRNEDWKSEAHIERNISRLVFPEGWSITDDLMENTKEKEHWYNAVVNYNFNERHLLTFEYSGSVSDGFTRGNTEQAITRGISDLTYGNVLDKEEDKTVNRNKFHVFYSGEITDKINLETNLGYSNLIKKNKLENNWTVIEDILGISGSQMFSQDINSTADALTFDFLFDHSIGKIHKLSYGAELSLLNENIRNYISENNPNNSVYRLNSFFVKAIAEYNLRLFQKVNINLGLNFMYSYLNDGNSTVTKNNYYTVIPYFALNYTDGDIYLKGSFRYNDRQPTAGLLDDSTVIYNSPYEITRGNHNLVNGIYTTADIYFSYKGFGAGFMHQYKKQAFLSAEMVENNNGLPLIVNTYNNFKKPLNDFYLYVDYLKEISFWTFSVYADLKYSHGSVEQEENVFRRISGLSAQISLKNRFNLPKNFSINLDGSYRTGGYIFIQYFKPMYGLNLIAEKRFWDGRLNIRIMLQGIVRNRFQETMYDMFGMGTYSKSCNSFDRSLEISAVWRFNNYKQVQRTKDNEYLRMLEQ